MVRAIVIGVGVLGLLLSSAPSSADPQFGGLGSKVRRKLEEKASEKVEDARRPKPTSCPDGEELRDGTCVRAQVDDPAPESPAAAPSGRGTAPAAAGASSAEGLAPGTGPWENYDFVPGARILFADDFTAERVGNFPRRLKFQKGNMQVIEWTGGRWLQAKGGSDFAVTLPEDLPERWSMELELTLTGNGLRIWANDANADEAPTLYLSYHTVAAEMPDGTDSKVDPRDFLGDQRFHPTANGSGLESEPLHLRLQADGAYLKGYVEEHRLLNVPVFGPWRGRQIYFRFGDNYENPSTYLTRLSINAGGLAMYEALMADGRLAVPGIYFDSGSDRLKPESSGTLAEMLDVLTQHPELKLTIEGHTDNVGAADQNMTLSTARAAAVRSYLVGKGVAAARLQSAGFGDTRPAAPNDSPENRQRNRRVELVVLR